MPIFKITFQDGTIFNGGNSILDSKWKDIPSKDILCLEFFLSENESFKLRNYESYNFFIEATKAVHGPAGTDKRLKLHNIYLMGLVKNKVVSHRYSLIDGTPGTDKYRIGDKTRRELPLGKEFRGQPTRGWKKGIK